MDNKFYTKIWERWTEDAAHPYGSGLSVTPNDDEKPHTSPVTRTAPAGMKIK